MDEPMMKCGHTANSYMLKGDKKIPGCVICNCFEVADNKPLLEGRVAKCCECGRIVPSEWNLPFFQYRRYNENKEDEFYCGCHGWD